MIELNVERWCIMNSLVSRTMPMCGLKAKRIAGKGDNVNSVSPFSARRLDEFVKL